MNGSSTAFDSWLTEFDTIECRLWRIDSKWSLSCLIFCDSTEIIFCRGGGEGGGGGGGEEDNSALISLAALVALLVKVLLVSVFKSKD